MNDISPAAELRAAADKLRPSSPAVAEHTVAVKLHPSIVEALAGWLEVEAASTAGDEVHDHCTASSCTTVAALAVARALLRGDR